MSESNPSSEPSRPPSHDRGLHALDAALGQYAPRQIRFRAGQLVGRYGFTEDDRDDLEQELYLDLLRRLPKFNPERASRRTFVARVVDHAVATIIERQTAACRDYRRTRLFCDCGVESDEGKATPLEELLDSATYLRLTDRTDPGDPDNVTLRLDLERVLSSLPLHLHEFCRLLATDTISEISRRTGIPRGTLYERVSDIRAHLERAGLREYL